MNLSKKYQLKNYLRIFVLLLGVTILLWNCEKEEEPVLLEQSNSKIKVYSYEKQEVTQITSIIERTGKKDPFIKNKSSKVTEPYWIDEENIFGVIDSVGNKTFVYRLYFNKMPENTFYNIIVSERVDNEISPMVIAYEMDGEEKKSMKYYELESFLNSLIQINNQTKNKGYAASGDDIIDITDCGELTNPSSSNTSSSGYGGSNNNNSDGNSYTVQNYNTYVSFGSYNVYSWGSPGGGGSRVTIEVGIGSFEYIANALKENAKKGDDDDRVICPEGELIIVVNNVVIIINELTGKAKCVYDKLQELSTGFSEAIKEFDGDFPVSHLKLNMKDIGNNRGFTQAPVGGLSPDYFITVSLNNNNSINGVSYRPSLMTAKTIIHEVLHAEMYRKLMSLTKQPNFDLVTEEELDTLLANSDYKQIYEYYRQYHDYQHPTMAFLYRNTIANMLKEFDDSKHSTKFYEDISWEGLIDNNVSWASLSTTEKDRIKNVIKDYISDNNNETCE